MCFNNFSKKIYTISNQNHHILIKKDEINIFCAINTNIYLLCLGGHGPASPLGSASGG
jgi:hypothetical protein